MVNVQSIWRSLLAQITDHKAPHILSTLAASYAESGDWENAVKWSEKAVELGRDTEHKEHLKKELDQFEEKKPWREIQDDKDEELSDKDDKNRPRKTKPKSPKRKSPTIKNQRIKRTGKYFKRIGSELRVILNSP